MWFRKLSGLLIIFGVSGCAAVAQERGLFAIQRDAERITEESPRIAEALNDAGIPDQIRKVIAEVTGETAAIVSLRLFAIVSQQEDFLPDGETGAAAQSRALSVTLAQSPQCQPPFPAEGSVWINGERYDVCKGPRDGVIYVDIWGVVEGSWGLLNTTRASCLSKSLNWLPQNLKTAICGR